VDRPDEPSDTAEERREWTAWAERGYAKPYQPRSVLRFGGAFFALFAVALAVVFWLAFSGRVP
jgi:hypothetical protein